MRVRPTGEAPDLIELTSTMERHPHTALRGDTRVDPRDQRDQRGQRNADVAEAEDRAQPPRRSIEREASGVHQRE